MKSKSIFWGIFLISVGVTAILYKLDFYYLKSVEYIYFVSLLLILFGFLILLKKEILKLIITILISLTLSFVLMRFVGDLIQNAEKCTTINIHYDRF